MGGSGGGYNLQVPFYVTDDRVREEKKILVLYSWEKISNKSG